jgi:predicted  nucleic acid-binding Zn-ribbon protein
MSNKLLLFVLATGAFAASSHQTEMMRANPIRKVVTMLQSMQAKVQEEGEKELALYDKYMCYCKTAGGDLQTSISSAGESISVLGNKIKAAEEQKIVLEEELKTAQSDRTAAKAAMAEATAIREKEAAAFAVEKANADKDIAAVAKAVAALDQGMAGAFLQTDTAQTLKAVIQTKKQLLMDDDRQDLMAFLSNTAGYAPQSGQITGILKTMGDEMAAGLADSTKAENGAIATYEKLMAAKTKEVNALTQEIETKLTRIGDLGVEIAQMKNDVGDTQEALIEDQKFLANLGQNCEKKKEEWAVIVKTRAEELVALADTIKVLNDDDALELFKKTLPSASSFVQLQVAGQALRAKARAELERYMQAHPKNAKLELLVLALQGKKIGFDKVIKMIDDMIITLKVEQEDDGAKKEYCGQELDSADDKKKGLERAVAGLETAIENGKDAIAHLGTEIAALIAGIKELDKMVMEATAQRQEENEDFKDLMASDTAAKELLKFAKNRLNKFYNPKLYKAPPKTELSRQDRIVEGLSGTAAPTEAPGGIANTGIAVLAEVSSHDQDNAAPPPPPATFGAYQKKSADSMGVMEMVDLLIADLDKEMTEAETTEKDAQADYETAMKDAAGKRTADSKLLSEKQSTKAETEADVQSKSEEKTSTSAELMSTMKYISSLHLECDWLLKYFDVRKEARASEIDALGQAKAVLSGADYSLLQTKDQRFLRRSA